MGGAVGRGGVWLSFLSVSSSSYSSSFLNLKRVGGVCGGASLIGVSVYTVQKRRLSSFEDAFGTVMAAEEKTSFVFFVD